MVDQFSSPGWVTELSASQPAGQSEPTTPVPTASVDAYRNTSDLAAAQIDSARNLRDILTDESRSRRAATFDAAELALAERKNRFSGSTRIIRVEPQLAAKLGKLQNNSTAVNLNISNKPQLAAKLKKLRNSSTTDSVTVSTKPQLAAQQTKLQSATDLLATSEADSSDEVHSLSKTATLTEMAFAVQGARLQTETKPVDPNDVTLSATTPPDHATPVVATVAILEAQDAELTDEQAADLQALGALPVSTQQELTDVLDAYLVYYRTIEASNGTDVRRVRAAQLQLLKAAADLETALNDSASQELLRPTVQIAGVVSIDLSTSHNTYREDYRLQIDAGGDDIYNNNAGGANASGKSTDVAALIDLGGSDTYNGRNGGGQYVVTKESPSLPTKRRSLPKKGEAVGFLLDAGNGDDTYNADAHGSNGGGRRGFGFLVDAGGLDTYNGSGEATNGAGSRRGSGFLLDAGTGDDTYDAGDKGVSNGGARGGRGFLFDVGGNDNYVGSNGAGSLPVENTFLYPVPICDTVPRNDKIRVSPCEIYYFSPLPIRKIPESGGFLLDGGGSDTYEAGNAGFRKTHANGGASLRASGFLLDAGTRNDTYDGKNGGASRPAASGFLLDTGGNDRYLATHHTTNGAGGGGLGFLMDGGMGDDTYNATTGSGPPGPRSSLGPGSLGTNGGGWGGGGHGFLVDAGGNDTYLAGSVGTNGGATSRDGDHPQGPPSPSSPTGFLLDVGGDDRYTAGEAGVNGGASRAVGLLYDNSGTDHYTEKRFRCIDCSDIPKGAIGAQIDRASGGENASRRTGPSEVLVVDDTVGADNADCADASYQAIQPAVDAAEPGDTVRVCVGTYPGNVTLNTRNVRLEAAEPGQVVIDGEHERRFGVALIASQTTVTGFTATNFSKRAGFLALGPATTVSDITISDSAHGIIAAGFYRGGAFQDIPVTATVIDGKQSTVIANNTVRDTKFGIKVAGTGNVRVSSNTVTGTQHGISVSGGKGITIHNNTVSGQGVSASKSQGGITSIRSGDITMTRNRVTGFTAPAQWDARDAFSYGYGINIRTRGGEGASHTLRNNRMANNKFNLMLGSGLDSTYKHFTIPPSNTVNGKPVVYLVGAVGTTIGPGGIRNLTLGTSIVPNTTLTNTKALRLVETPGYVACVRCVDVTVRNLEFSHNGHGVLFVKSRGVQVTNVTVHDTVKGIGLRGSPTLAELANNTVRETGLAMNVIHNCGVRRGKDFDAVYREVTSGSFEVCATPSVLIANNTITRIGNRFWGIARHSRAVMISGKGVTLRDNTISNVLGTGITMHGGPRFRTPGIVLGGIGLQLSPNSISPSRMSDNLISDAHVGLRMSGTDGATVAANTISDTAVGLIIRSNSQNTYRANTVTNATTGMFVTRTEFSLTARNNTFREVGWGLDVQFLYQGNPPEAQASHDFGSSNTVNGERILWLTGAVSRTIDAGDANMVVCIRCVDVTIRDMTITDNAHGIVLWGSVSSRVTDVKVKDTKRTGVLIRGGANNTVQDSTIIDSTEPIWVVPITPRSIPLSERAVPGVVDQPTKNQSTRAILGQVRIVNNRVSVDNASYPERRGTFLTTPVIWGHFGIALYGPTAATVTGNNITDNRWGVYWKRGSWIKKGSDLSNLRIKNNTITHAREPAGRGRFGANIGPDRRSTLGVKVQGNLPESSNGSIVIQNNSLTADLSPPGSMDFSYGVTVRGKKLPQTVITDNTVQGYQQSVRVGTGWNNTTVSIHRNRLNGAQSASVLISGKTPGDAVEIHQNLLNPGRFGYGVKFKMSSIGRAGHMMSDGSNGSGGSPTPHGTLPVDATCNRWAAPSGPSSQRMTLADPVTKEPADGSGSAVSHGHRHGMSNVHFHPWIGESPGRSCAKELVGTATPTPTPGPTRTPWPTAEPSSGPGDGPGLGKGNGTGPGEGNGTGRGPGTATAAGGGEGTSTVTARVAPTNTPTGTPPPTATPEIVPGFGGGVWVVAFALLVAVLAARRLD